MRAALKTGIRTRIDMYKRTNIIPLEQFYTQTGQNTFLRLATNKNNTVLKTLFNKNIKRNIAFWLPPLDHIYNTLTTTQFCYVAAVGLQYDVAGC